MLAVRWGWESGRCSLLAGSPFLDEAGQESKPRRGGRENNFDLHSKHDFYLLDLILLLFHAHIYLYPFACQVLAQSCLPDAETLTTGSRRL